LTHARPFSEAIRAAQNNGNVPVIVDIKPVSPRDGNLLKKRSPADLGRSVKAAGACAVSVVTESGHFGGSIDMLREVARACELPVLQKDFFSETSQVIESYEAGASAFLLILATTPDAVAQKLYRKGRQLGMEAVVEIHTDQELKRALKLAPTIIGINNRDIQRLELDAGDVRITENLAPSVPEQIVTISESSLLCRDDVRRAIRAGADAVLIGTAVLQADDLAACIKDLTTS
jgi:indole-3-glycerol phosphate synthase